MKELEALEKKRKICPLFLKIGIAGIATGVILFIILMFLESSFLVFVASAFVIPGIVFIVLSLTKFHSIEKEFKRTCMSDIVNQVIPGSSYEEKMGIPLNDIYRYNILKKADRSRMEDLIYGTISGVKYKTCDLVLEERRVHTDSKGNTTVTYVPYFVGRFFEFDFNKNFKGDIIVTETAMFKPLKMQKISLESEEFNKKFKTFANDEFSAFYVLTPQLMMSLLDLEKANPGAISIAINSNKLALALNNNRDTFTLKMNQEINGKVLEAFKKDINIIYQIIDELNLNNKIFKKEY